MIATVSFCATALIFHARREHENLFGSSNKRKLVKRCWISVCASEFFVLFLELRQHFYLRAIFNACFVVQVIHVLPLLFIYICILHVAGIKDVPRIHRILKSPSLGICRYFSI